ncbi:hypothetical protein F5Y10DRAFT_291997 [Nemania abortiva]|nr:hypothetical protein F5Y10DRAFT_291997 [Nemania abortiva]
MICLLGPDFLFGIALGQLSSARRCVKMFENDKALGQPTKFTYRQAFFVNMGGIFLTSPDFPNGFPITGKQLHYLVKHGHVEFPDMESMSIDERNTTDTLSRLLTIWQVTWFSIVEFQRIHIGLPLTTLELTALSFVFVMIGTSICWLRKPSISRPRFIPTKNEKRLEDIRAEARQTTHPDLTDTWYRTPVDFVSERPWMIGKHWAYYTRLAEMLHLKIVSRPITSHPWDRLPSDTFLPLDMFFVPFGAVFLFTFGISFTLAWNFHFPTPTERLLWRIFSLYHIIFVSIGGLYTLMGIIQWAKQDGRQPAAQPQDSYHRLPLRDSSPEVVAQGVDPEVQGVAGIESPSGILRYMHRFRLWIGSWRNITADQDPEFTVQLRIVGPVTVLCASYIIARAYIYAEDLISLRSQPAGVYLTVNRFVPFLGS